MNHFWNWNYLTSFEQIMVIVCTIGYLYGLYQIYTAKNIKEE